MKHFTMVFLWIFLIIEVMTAQVNIEWEKQNRVTNAHLRGLCVVDDAVTWASGTKGTVLRTDNGGDSWQVMAIPNASDLDFRDIHAFDADNAMVISAGGKARIFRTENGGDSWELVYQNDQKGIFFDGLDFKDAQNGMAYSDPIDGKFVLIQTKDGGSSWTNVDAQLLPPSLEGEAGYAASGTGIVWQKDHIWVATGGGKSSRVLHSPDNGQSWEFHDTPMVVGEGKGIFSMAFLDAQYGVLVGGSYIDSTNVSGNCAISSDSGMSWELIDSQQPKGYRSCVAVHPAKKLWIAVGRTGSDYSTNNGKTWQAIETEGYYVCGFAKQTIWAVGKSGKMAKAVLRD